MNPNASSSTESHDRPRGANSASAATSSGRAGWAFAWDAAIVLAAMAVCAMTIMWFGDHYWQWADERNDHIFDMSMVIDASYRAFLGQRPCADFISVLPIGLYSLGALAMRCFGVNWSALVDIAAVWMALILGWEFFLLRRLGASRWWSVGIAGAIVAVTLMRPCLYHTNFTTPVGAVLITSMLLLLRSPHDRLAIVSVGGAAFLLTLGKQNSALHLPIVAGIAAATPEIRRRVFVVLSLAGAAALLVIWDGAGSVSGYAASLLTAGPRALPRVSTMFGNLRGGGAMWFCLDSAMVAFAAIPLAFRERWNRPWRESALMAGAVAVSIYGMATNLTLKMADLPPVIVAAFVPWALDGAWRRATPIVRAGVGWALCAVTILGVGAGLLRLTLATDRMQFSWGLPRVPMPPDDPFFAHLSATPRFAAIERDISTAVDRFKPGKDAVFFGSVLEFAYAAHGFVSPRGLPVWWHPGTSYSVKDGGRITERFQQWHPRVCIFLRDHMPNMPEAMAPWITTHYQRHDIGELSVYVAPEASTH